MLASLERGRELFEAGAITNVEFQALKQKLLKQAKVQPAIAEAAYVWPSLCAHPAAPELLQADRQCVCATQSAAAGREDGGRGATRKGACTEGVGSSVCTEDPSRGGARVRPAARSELLA